MEWKIIYTFYARNDEIGEIKIGLCGGKEIEYKDVMPAELQKLRKSLATVMQRNIITDDEGNIIGIQPATGMPEGFPLYAQMDPLTLMARNIMFGMGGQQPQGVADYGTYQWGDYIRPQPTPVGPVGPITPGVTAIVSPDVQPSVTGPEAISDVKPTVMPWQPKPTVDTKPTEEPGPSVLAYPVPEPGPEPLISPAPGPLVTPGPSPEPQPGPVIVEPKPKVEPKPSVDVKPEPTPVGPVGPIGPGPVGPVGPTATTIAGAWGVMAGAGVGAGAEVGARAGVRAGAGAGTRPRAGVYAGPQAEIGIIVSPNAEVVLVGPTATATITATATADVTALTVVPGAIIRPQPGAIDMGMVGIRPIRQY